MPIFDYWCPGILQDGKQCAQLLGQGQCSLCQFHLQFIKNEKNFHQQILPSSFEWTKILQFDLYFHQLEIAEEDSFLYYFKKSTKSLPMKYNQLEFDSFTFGDWPLYFVLFYHLDSRIDDWPPLPHPGKLPNKLPDFTKINQTSSTQGTLSVRDSSLTTSLHASGTQKTSASSSGTARRPSWTTGRSPSRTTQISTLKELYASLGTS